MRERVLYPFTAIAGQEEMKLALLLVAVHPALGGVLVRGDRGTAKSTAVRALTTLLPEIDAVAGCLYGCDPHDAEPCDECAASRDAGEELGSVRRPVPVVELPVGATEDRVIGSIDLETAIGEGRRRFEPGLLARAHRGILYVDEVNLLNDHLVDVLLDAAAMGVNHVEREGVSVSHPARFLLIGTMNPEEGELRPQLLDRFALAVDVHSPRDPAERAEAVRRRIAFERDPMAFLGAWAGAEAAERERVERARALLPAVTVPEPVLELITRICVAFEVDGLRADLAIYRAATAHAALADRTEVTRDDVRVAAALALPHRRRRQPFEQPGMDNDRLDQMIADDAEDDPTDPPDSGGEGDGPGSHERGPSSAGSAGQGDRSNGAGADGAGGTVPHQRSRRADAGQKEPAQATAAPDAPYAVAPFARPRRPRAPRASGRQQAARAQTPRGPAVRAAVPHGAAGDLALVATLRAAAPFQPVRHAQAGGRGQPAVLLRRSDVRERVRQGRPRHLIMLVVDASGSMGARDRMRATKGAVLSLLLDAYRRRDRVGLVAFRGAGAEPLLPPTNSVDLAERRLRSLPTGGRTPLAAALDLTVETVARAGRALDAEPLLVLVSDVRPNAAGAGTDPWRAALAGAERVRQAGWDAVVIDTEPARVALRLGPRLAVAMGARHLKLEELRAGDIERAVHTLRRGA